MANVCMLKSRQLLAPASSLAGYVTINVTAPCRPLCSVSSPRPSLDDVERLSRGEPSKAKIGSRAVPHRLNAGERTAYELAKKRGYLVQQFRTREYPLSNTYRNYCDALGWPNLRIDQEPAGSLDTMVVDLTTLRLEEGDLKKLQGEIRQCIFAEINSRSNQAEVEEAAVVKHNEAPADVNARLEPEKPRSGILHFQISRSDARRLAQVVRDCCKDYIPTSSRKLGA